MNAKQHSGPGPPKIDLKDILNKTTPTTMSTKTISTGNGVDVVDACQLSNTMKTITAATSTSAMKSTISNNNPNNNNNNNNKNNNNSMYGGSEILTSSSSTCMSTIMPTTSAKTQTSMSINNIHSNGNNSNSNGTNVISCAQQHHLQEQQYQKQHQQQQKQQSSSSLSSQAQLQSHNSKCTSLTLSSSTTTTTAAPPVTRTISSDRLVTGPSCKALKTAVSALYSVDDFHKEKIGSGFFSEVYKVTHRTTGEVMVLKMNQLRANRPNMLKEVQLLNKLSHPNILSFMGVCVQEGQLHALTEYISGGSLEQLLAKTEVELTAVMKMRLALGIARGMAYVHDVGIFHRDLTSKNVLIRDLPDSTFDAVVGDFGLAAKIPDKKVKQRLDTVGSPYWVSPECLKGQWYDHTSDVFSFGIIQCEIIARIEADPDIMPRTDSFGLDYLAFVELCPMDTPPVFLRLAFYCCIYDPKSRPNFHDAAKKLALLVDKYQQVRSDNGSSSPLSSLEMNGSSPIGSDAESLTPETLAYHRQVLKKCHLPVGLQQVNENGFNFSATSSGMNSSSSTTLTADELDDSFLKPGVLLLFDTETLAQQHRRSLSENIIHFPLHTTPSDKARCHQMQRQRSSTHSPTPPPKTAAIALNTSILEQHAADVKINNTTAVLTLHKVAETMCLKDIQYKPIRLDHNGVKSNPFTAMAQLRGVKKILGANPKSYAAGVGDLFSSCFEMSAPFFKEALQKTAAMAGEDISAYGAVVGIKAGKLVVAPPNEPKSLPTSPQLSRRFSNIEIKLSPTLPTRLLADGAGQLAAADEEDDCEDCTSDAEQDADGGGNCADAESSSDDSAERPTTSSARKHRANSLFTHPLFRSTGGACASSKSDEVINTLASTASCAVDDTNSSEDGAENTALKSRPVSVSAAAPPSPPPPPATSAPSIATPASISSCTDFELHEVKPCDFMPAKSTLTRRDSIESGFYSCFNEESDAAINPTYKHFNPSSLALTCGGNCCFEQLKSQLVLDSTAPEELSDKLASLCRCCYYGSSSAGAPGQQQLHNESLSSSSSVLLIDDGVGSTTSSGVSLSNAMALRSFDDLELTDATRPHRRYTCHHHLLHSGISGNAGHQHIVGDTHGATSNNAATSSIDMGLINRLALDTEIHSLMQRSPFAANQLLYCKNRTSSIYTDSSDDISSLAGSDSLLWDDRSFTVIPNTRSAQIAKIVEYFERKRQVPDHTPPSHRNTTGGGHTPNGASSSSVAAAVAASALNPNYLTYESRRYSEIKRQTAFNSDYEAFCFELDKKPTQQRLMVCEGAVKSKLQIFDKLKQQQQQQQLQQLQQQQQQLMNQQQQQQHHQKTQQEQQQQHNNNKNKINPT